MDSDKRSGWVPGVLYWPPLAAAAQAAPPQAAPPAPTELPKAASNWGLMLAARAVGNTLGVAMRLIGRLRA